MTSQLGQVSGGYWWYGCASLYMWEVGENILHILETGELGLVLIVQERDKEAMVEDFTAGANQAVADIGHVGEVVLCEQFPEYRGTREQLQSIVL